MKILVDSDGLTVAYAPHIEFGVFDEIEKWGLFDMEDKKTRKVLLYVIDHDYTLVENVELPEDYEVGKYFYEDGEFVLNENWAPPLPSAEERIAKLEASNAALEEQLLMTDETTVALYESQMIQEEVNIAQDATLVEIFELLENI